MKQSPPDQSNLVLSEGLLRTNRQVEVVDGGGITRLRIEATQTCAKTPTTLKMSKRRKHTNQEGENNDNKTRRRGRTQTTRTTPPGVQEELRSNRLQSRTSSNPKTGKTRVTSKVDGHEGSTTKEHRWCQGDVDAEPSHRSGREQLTGTKLTLVKFTQTAQQAHVPLPYRPSNLRMRVVTQHLAKWATPHRSRLQL